MKHRKAKRGNERTLTPKQIGANREAARMEETRTEGRTVPPRSRINPHD